MALEQCQRDRIPRGDVAGVVGVQMIPAVKGLHIEKVITDHWAIMGKYDPRHLTRFVIDEWGNWYRGGTEPGPEYILSQAITLRDALHTAMTFDVFNAHAEKIEMANVAQTINCLHSLFAAVGDKYTRTPAYYASRCIGRTWVGGRCPCGSISRR